MSTSKAKKSEAVAKPSQPSAAKNAGYKGHKAGSDARPQKLAEGTLRSWFGQWQRRLQRRCAIGKFEPTMELGDRQKRRGAISNRARHRRSMVDRLKALDPNRPIREADI